MRDVQILMTLNPFTFGLNTREKHAKGVTSDYSSWLALFSNFGSLDNVVIREQVQSILGLSRSRLRGTIVFSKVHVLRYSTK